MLLWSLAALAAILYCVARAILDFRQRKYAWAALGLGSAVVLLLAPVTTHAVKVDLPISANR
jgi:hypothetical protein